MGVGGVGGPSGVSILKSIRAIHINKVSLIVPALDSST